MEAKVTIRSKKSFLNHWVLVKLNLSSDDIRNCKETKFVKECEKNVECKKKGVCNLAYKQGFLLEKPKEPDKF